MALKFVDSKAKQVFLGRLYEKEPKFVDLVTDPTKVFIVNLSEGEKTFNEKEFNRHWKKIKEVSDLFDLRVTVADTLLNHWELSEAGNAQKVTAIEKLFTNEEWIYLRICLKNGRNK